MTEENSIQGYAKSAKMLHWLMALAIIMMLPVGFTMEGYPESIKWTAYGLHKSTGILLFTLVIIRVMVRLKNTPPALPDNMSKLQVLAVHVAHFSLYGLMFVLPLSGWAMSSAGGYPVDFYGLFVVPPLIEKNKELFDLTKELHEFFGITIAVLVGLHIAAALYHHFRLKDDVLKRMLCRCCKKCEK